MSHTRLLDLKSSLKLLKAWTTNTASGSIDLFLPEKQTLGDYNDSYIGFYYAS